ncbi:hypothetical protein Tco_1375710 [Tanacetum coccineum]
MDDPNITMEEYIRLEEEKAQRHGRTFNWQSATYGKIEYCEDEDNRFTNFRTEYPTIVFDDTLTSDAALSCEPTVTPLNKNESDFKISFDESDDEDYMPMISHSDDLNFFKDFENEFPTITYDDDLTSKLTEPSIRYGVSIPDGYGVSNDFPQILNPIQHMAPLPPRDQRHQWLRYQVEGYTEDIMHNYEQRLKTIWGRSVNRVHILDFSRLTEGMRRTLADRLRMVYTGDEGQELFTSHAWRRLFEIRAPLVREFILEFLSTCWMSDTEMGLDVADTLCFQLGGARRRMTWRQFILALGLHTDEEMAEDGFRAYWLGSERVIPDKGDLRDYWIEISSNRDFLGPAFSYVFIQDPVRRLCHKMISCSISGRGRHLRRHAEGRKSGARFSEGHFIGRLAAHFGLVSDQGLRGLSVVTHELPLIDLHKLRRLNIRERIGDTWAWVAPGPERQSDAAAGATRAAEDAPAVDEGAQVDPTHMQAPQPPPPAPRTMPQRIARLEEEVQELRRSIVGLRRDVERSIADQCRVEIPKPLHEKSVEMCEEADEKKEKDLAVKKSTIWYTLNKTVLLNSYEHSDTSVNKPFAQNSNWRIIPSNISEYSVLTDHLIRRIHQLDTTNNTAYSVKSIRRNHLTRAMTNVITEFIIREILEKAVTNSNSKLTATWVDLDELCKKIFKDLQCHAFNGNEEDDDVDHIADFLEILDPIKMEIFDTNQLRVNIFPLSLTGDAKMWWLNERDNKITAWGMLAGRIDRVTKSALGHAWVYKWGINDSENDTVSSDEEWEEHEYGNPPNDSLPKPYLNINNEKDKNHHNENNGDADKLGGMDLSGAPHSEKINNVQPNEGVCRVDKFEVIKYKIGDSE